MNRWRARWDSYWFTPQAPDDLSIARIAFYGLLFVLYLPEELYAWGDVSDVFWEPVSFFKWFRIRALPAIHLAILGIVWKLSLLVAAFGLFTRISTGVAFGLGVYLLGLPHNFGKVHHFDAMVVLVLGILFLSRCGDAWSLDRARLRRQGQVAAPPHSDYRWPLRAIWMLMALVFFGAGFSKIRHGGWEWVASDNMSIQLFRHAYQIANQDPAAPQLALYLARHPWMCSVLALGTVVIEAGYPAALVSRRARAFFPAGMCFALLGIRLLMGPTFPQFIICHVFWIPWGRLVDWGTRVRQNFTLPKVGPAPS